MSTLVRFRSRTYVILRLKRILCPVIWTIVVCIIIGRNVRLERNVLRRIFFGRPCIIIGRNVRLERNVLRRIFFGRIVTEIVRNGVIIKQLQLLTTKTQFLIWIHENWGNVTFWALLKADDHFQNKNNPRLHWTWRSYSEKFSKSANCNFHNFCIRNEKNVKQIKFFKFLNLKLFKYFDWFRESRFLNRPGIIFSQSSLYVLYVYLKVFNLPFPISSRRLMKWNETIIVTFFQLTRTDQNSSTNSTF